MTKTRDSCVNGKSCNWIKLMMEEGIHNHGSLNLNYLIRACDIQYFSFRFEWFAFTGSNKRLRLKWKTRSRAKSWNLRLNWLLIDYKFLKNDEIQSLNRNSILTSFRMNIQDELYAEFCKLCTEWGVEKNHCERPKGTMTKKMQEASSIISRISGRVKGQVKSMSD